MRIAAFALACLLGAAAMKAAVAAESGPALNLPPFPSSPPAPAGAPAGGVRPNAAPRPRVEIARAPRGRVCFNQAETREKITQRRLTDPIDATRSGRAEGEVLRTRLCRWKQEDLVYEVFVLRRDGRVLRLYINAQNGKAVSAAEMAEH